MKKFSVLFCGLVGFFVISIALGQSEQGLFNEDEAKTAWKKMASLIENCSGEVLAYHEGLPNTEGRLVAFKEEFQINSGGRCFKATHWKQKNENEGKLSPYKVFCTNEKNLFSLKSTENGSGDTDIKEAWSVLEVRLNSVPLEKNPVLTTQSDLGGLRFLHASHVFFGIPLWDLWNDANFSIKNIKPDSADPSLVIVNFHWVIPENKMPPKRTGVPYISPNVEITLTLNPQSFWRIEKQIVVATESANGKSTKVFSSSYPEYQLSEEGIPYVVKVNCYHSRDHYVEKAMPVYVGEITYKSFAPSPESDFRLSYYGFPEPDSSGKTSWGRYVTTAIGVFLIVFALWSMYCRRKKRNEGRDAEK